MVGPRGVADGPGADVAIDGEGWKRPKVTHLSLSSLSPPLFLSLSLSLSLLSLSLQTA